MSDIAKDDPPRLIVRDLARRTAQSQRIAAHRVVLAFQGGLSSQDVVGIRSQQDQVYDESGLPR